MKRIAIVGCRPPKGYEPSEPYRLWPREWHWFDWLLQDAKHFVADLREEWRPRLKELVIVSGGARGVDTMAASEARCWGIRVIEHLPDYERHGKEAPLERNTLIVQDADVVHAWPGPWSRGTWDTVRKARAAGKPCVVHEPWKGASG